jgi:hypothetical protein
MNKNDDKMSFLFISRLFTHVQKLNTTSWGIIAKFGFGAGGM